LQRVLIGVAGVTRLVNAVLYPKEKTGLWRWQQSEGIENKRFVKLVKILNSRFRGIVKQGEGFYRSILGFVLEFGWKTNLNKQLMLRIVHHRREKDSPQMTRMSWARSSIFAGNA